MNKSDLVADVARQSGLTRTDSEKAVDAVFEAITATLKKGDEVRLVGFGTFATAVREASKGRNPRTGAALNIPKKTLPKFRPGKQLKEAVDQ